MTEEVSLSVVLVEVEDGIYKAVCPELGIEVKAPDAESAVKNLKEAARGHIKKIGAKNIRLNKVRCAKFKASLD